MASIRVPSNVSSVTLVTSGVLTPTAGVITGMTAAELTDLVSPYSWGPAHNNVVSSNLSTGALEMRVPASITSITINGVVKAVTAGVISAVAAADATEFILSAGGSSPFFKLVSP